MLEVSGSEVQPFSPSRLSDRQNKKHWGRSAIASFPRLLRVRGDVLGDIVMIKLGGFIEGVAPNLAWYCGWTVF